jgi:membrane-associated phospholipid phosphatase
MIRTYSMKQIVVMLALASAATAQRPVAMPMPAPEKIASAAQWKTWILPSASDHGVPAPPDAAATAAEMDWLKAAMMEQDPRILEQMRYWNAGPPSYRWMDMVTARQSAGMPNGPSMVHAYTYVSLAVYDATVAAWNAKYQYKRARPAVQGMTPRVGMPASPSYPSDYAATAFAAAEVMAHMVPAEAASFRAMAEEAGKSRLYAGVEYPSDYFAGMELGRRVAQMVIARMQADGSLTPWTGSVPTGPCTWTGTNPGNAAAAAWKPFLLASPSEFRPAPPAPCNSPEVQADLAMVKAFPRALTMANLNTNSRALYWQTAEGVYPWAYAQLNRWVLEDRMEHNPPMAARAYALLAAVGFDTFIASQDAKFTYWYPRPHMLDSSLTMLFNAPNFPSYPSNHSALSIARSEVLAYLFPERAHTIRAMGKEAGDSRIWAGIHFEMDNRAGAEMGRKIAQKFIAWAEGDGSQQ